MWWWRQTLTGADGDIDIGFTDRLGGLSGAGFASLNLGGHVGDDPGHVRANRGRLAADLGVTDDALVLMQQVHGADVEVVTARRTGAAPPADGVVTATRGLALVVLVADCTPVLLVDPDAGVAAAVHAGRPGMLAGAVPAALDAMAGLGAGAIRAIVGPSVCGRCYEVPAAMRDEAARVAPAAVAVSWTGTPAVDVAAGVVSQLRARDVPVTWVPGCTREEERLFSYRRDHGAGRFAGVILMREAAA